MLFQDRTDAGRRLATSLMRLRGQNCAVLALPRGGVPVASEVAKELGAPLDLLLVRKIGAPRHPELAIGSVIDGASPIVVRDNGLIRMTGTTAREFDEICLRELEEIERRRKFYMENRKPISLAGKIAIIVDDGLATGNTMRAALHAVRLRKPRQVIMAVPVAPKEVFDDFREEADEVVCLATPDPFGAVGCFYRDFEPTSDAEVVRLMRQSKAEELPREPQIG